MNNKLEEEQNLIAQLQKKIKELQVVMSLTNAYVFNHWKKSLHTFWHNELCILFACWFINDNMYNKYCSINND